MSTLKQPPKTQVPASACADTCIGLRRYLHEATQVSALKPHSFTVQGTGSSDPKEVESTGLK